MIKRTFLAATQIQSQKPKSHNRMCRMCTRISLIFSNKRLCMANTMCGKCFLFTIFPFKCPSHFLHIKLIWLDFNFSVQFPEPRVNLSTHTNSDVHNLNTLLNKNMKIAENSNVAYVCRLHT